MQVARVMSSPAIAAAPTTPYWKAAAVMREADVGMLPIVAGMAIVGVVTDRDIVTRLLCQPGIDADAPVSLAMTPDPVTCYADHSVAAVAAIMGDNQIRRLPVLDRDGRLVGVVSLGDIAEHASELLAGEALGEIVEARSHGRGRGPPL